MVCVRWNLIPAVRALKNGSPCAELGAAEFTPDVRWKFQRNRTAAPDIFGIACIFSVGRTGACTSLAICTGMSKKNFKMMPAAMWLGCVVTYWHGIFKFKHRIYKEMMLFCTCAGWDRLSNKFAFQNIAIPSLYLFLQRLHIGWCKEMEPALGSRYLVTWVCGNVVPRYCTVIGRYVGYAQML